MGSPKLQSFVSRLIERLATITLAGLAAESEAEAALHEAQHLDRIEQAARQYEADDKPQLADRLRQRAKAVSVENPASIALAALESKEPEPATPSLAITDETETESPPKRRRRRRSQDCPSDGSDS